MCPEIMREVAGKFEFVCDAVLNDYICLAVKEEEYPGIKANIGSKTTGKLYTGISDEGVDRLDVFEGEYYQRTEVMVEDIDGTKYMADTYMFRDKYSDFLCSIEWDFQDFEKNGKKLFEDNYFGWKELAE